MMYDFVEGDICSMNGLDHFRGGRKNISHHDRIHQSAVSVKPCFLRSPENHVKLNIIVAYLVIFWSILFIFFEKLYPKAVCD